jgi:CheY-like chemotaxis protein
MKKRILSISYDEALLAMREMLLEREGYDVTSALGFVAAMEVCIRCDKFDLILMGHSIPQKDKIALFESLRSRCAAPLLSIARSDDPPLPQAAHSIKPTEHPEALLVAVKLTLENSSKSSPEVKLPAY